MIFPMPRISGNEIIDGVSYIAQLLSANDGFPVNKEKIVDPNRFFICEDSRTCGLACIS